MLVPCSSKALNRITKPMNRVCQFSNEVGVVLDEVFLIILEDHDSRGGTKQPRELVEESIFRLLHDEIVKIPSDVKRFSDETIQSRWRIRLQKSSKTKLNSR
jgi:hypothetical protein